MGAALDRFDDACSLRVAEQFAPGGVRVLFVSTDNASAHVTPRVFGSKESGSVIVFANVTFGRQAPFALTFKCGDGHCVKCLSFALHERVLSDGDELDDKGAHCFRR